MRIHALQYPIVVLLLALPSIESRAQAPNYNPFFVTSYGGSYYRPDQGQLTLPSVNVLPGTNNQQQVLQNVVLQHTGGTSFEFVSFDELSPEQECTRAEVSEAIPQLEFGLTVAQAELLIGCSANLQSGRVDLDTGREVFASWVGNDGVANNQNGLSGGGFIRGGSSVWIGGTSGSVFRTSLTSSNGSPSITFSLRENVLESVSYSVSDQIRFCYNEELLAGFRQVNINDDYSALVAALSCEGNLRGVAFDDTTLQQEYNWYVPPASQSGLPFVTPGVWSRVLNESIQVTLVDNRVQSLRYDSNKQVSADAVCSIEDIVAAEGQVQVGQTVTDLSELLDCGVRAESLSSNGLSETMSYSWRTTIPNESLFVSSNRSLNVVVTDGVVSFVRLGRF